MNIIGRKELGYSNGHPKGHNNLNTPQPSTLKLTVTTRGALPKAAPPLLLLDDGHGIGLLLAGRGRICEGRSGLGFGFTSHVEFIGSGTGVGGPLGT